MSSLPTIAVLSASSALVAVLGATLRRERNWRVREFSDAASLNAYMRLAPMAILVSDYELDDYTAADLASNIRSDGTLISPNLQIVALSRSVDRVVRRRCVEAGIDEVIVKPMSPLYLEERVRARLREGARHVWALPAYLGPERRERLEIDDERALPIERRGNVVSLLAHRAVRGNAPPSL